MIRALAGLVFLVPGIATAQAYSCGVPDASVMSVRPDVASEKEPQRLLPIGHYTLAISWSPQYCRKPDAAARSRFQCGGSNRFGFVLHGLWPDGLGKEWPQYCKATSLLPEVTLRANMCSTPSAQLLQHEWAKHGTCMPGETPDSYFRRATTMFRKLRYPDMISLSRQSGLNAGRLAAAIARVNPGMKANGMRITTDRLRWLDEVWICLDRSFRYARCPAHQGGVKPRARVKIWRGER